MSAIEDVIQQKKAIIKEYKKTFEKLKTEYLNIRNLIKTTNERCNKILKNLTNKKGLIATFTLKHQKEKLIALSKNLEKYNKMAMEIRDKIIDIENKLEFENDQLKDLYVVYNKQTDKEMEK